MNHGEALHTLKFFFFLGEGLFLTWQKISLTLAGRRRGSVRRCGRRRSWGCGQTSRWPGGCRNSPSERHAATHPRQLDTLFLLLCYSSPNNWCYRLLKCVFVRKIFVKTIVSGIRCWQNDVSKLVQDQENESEMFYLKGHWGERLLNLNFGSINVNQSTFCTKLNYSRSYPRAMCPLC